MTLSRGTWVKQNGTVGNTAADARRADAGLFYQNAPGVVRTGLLSRVSGLQLVTGNTGALNYTVAAFPAFIIGRAANEGCYVMSGQGTTTTANVAAAPAAGLSRWDLIWIKQNDIEKGDPDNQPVLGVTQGTAATSPVKPEASVPAGAVVLAEAQIFSGTTGTAGGANTITQRWRYTALDGDPLPVRNAAERAEITTPKSGDQVARLDLESKGLALEDWNGSAWLPRQRQPKVVLIDGAHVGPGSGLAAKVASGEVQIIRFMGTYVGVTDQSGYLGINWPAGTFPNGWIQAQLTNGDSSAGRGLVISVAGAPFAQDNSRCVISVTDGTGSIAANRTVRVDFDIVGW